MKTYLIISLTFMLTLSANSGENHQSKYVGQEHRAIKTLSENDIEELKQGAGWGLAKAAELNGVPGPIHILEMADKINLSDKQTQQIKQLHGAMKAQAVPLGEKLIQLEYQLNNAFAENTINQTKLTHYIEQIEQVRATLRTVHLSTHLQTPNILTYAQIKLYNQLRGYDSDPCQNIPEGHNAELWRKHNSCG